MLKNFFFTSLTALVLLIPLSGFADYDPNTLELETPEETAEIPVETTVETPQETAEIPVETTVEIPAETTVKPEKRKGEITCNLNLLPGENFLRKIVLDFTKHENKTKSKTMLETTVLYRVFGIDEQGNYHIGARPLDLQAAVSLPDEETYELASKQKPDSIEEDFKGETFILQVSPNGKILSTLNKEALRNNFKEILQTCEYKQDTKKENRDSTEQAKNALFATIAENLQQMVSSCFFQYSRDPIAMSQKWQSPAASAPTWLSLLVQKATLVGGQEVKILKKESGKREYALDLNGYSLISTTDKNFVHVGHLKGKCKVDKSTFWLKRGKATWYIRKHQIVAKNRLRALPESEFWAEANLEVE